MDYTTWTIEQLNERRNAILTELEAEGADLDALQNEAREINAEIERRRQQETQRAEIRTMVAGGAGSVRTGFAGVSTRERRFAVDSIEYRNAWLRQVIGWDLNEEERAALTSAAAVIPTLTVNAVWDRLINEAELLGRVDVSQFPSYVRFPKATTVNAATAHAVGATITESSDVVGYVDLTPNEYVKLLTVGADIDHMAIDAVHDWIVNNIVGSIRQKMNVDVPTGSGANCLKGIATSVSANATAFPAAANVKSDSFLAIMAALGSNYQDGAIWIMTPSMFYSEAMALPELENYVINDGFKFKLFGHDVVLMNEALISSKETIFYGDPKAYKCNIFKALDVKTFETATTTNLQFRGAILADGELIDNNAFVRFARA